MRSKREIENTIAHMRSGCSADPAVNTIWIEALEWVLGDSAHRSTYDDWIRAIENLTKTDDPESPNLRAVHLGIMRFSISELLQRLR